MANEPDTVDPNPQGAIAWIAIAIGAKRAGYRDLERIARRELKRCHGLKFSVEIVGATPPPRREWDPAGGRHE